MISTGGGMGAGLAGLLACVLLSTLGLFAGAPAASGAVIAGQKEAADGLLSPAASDPASRPVSPEPGSDAGETGSWSRQEMLKARPLPATGGGSTTAFGPAPATGSGADVSRAAVPAETVPDPEAPGFRTNGKLFFRLGDGPDNAYTCSGTVVRSMRRNVVITAGHCVFDVMAESQPGVWATDLAFVPGYHDGLAPFGQFPVPSAGIVTTRGWQRDQLQNYDLAALSLDGRVEDTTGARRIEFGADLRGRPLEIFGYPAEPAPEFDGEKLIRCVPAAVGFDTTRLAPLPYGVRPCRLWAGASGGGWILGDRYLVSVVSYGYCSTPTPPEQRTCGPELYGPQFGSAAVNLINADAIGGTASPTVRVVRRPAHRIRKRTATFRVAGGGSTPIERFKVRLDRQRWVFTGPVIRIRRLSLTSHTLRIRSVDQTGRLSPRTIKQKFRVLPKKKKRKRKRRRNRR